MILFDKNVKMKLCSNQSCDQFAIQVESKKNFNIPTQVNKDLKIIFDYDESFPTILDELKLEIDRANTLDWNHFPIKWIGWMAYLDRRNKNIVKHYNILKKHNFLCLDLIDDNEKVLYICERNGSSSPLYVGPHPDHELLDKIIVTNKKIMMLIYYVQSHAKTPYEPWEHVGWKPKFLTFFADIQDILTFKGTFGIFTENIAIRTSAEDFEIKALKKDDIKEIIELFSKNKFYGKLGIG
jgi:hypothetical protein